MKRIHLFDGNTRFHFSLLLQNESALKIRLVRITSSIIVSNHSPTHLTIQLKLTSHLPLEINPSLSIS